MMKVKLTDAQWRKILPFLQTCTNINIGGGIQWELLQHELGFPTKIHLARGRFGQSAEVLCDSRAGLRYYTARKAGRRARVYSADRRTKAMTRQTLSNLSGDTLKLLSHPRADRRRSRDYDRHIYKLRHSAESFIGKIEHFRRIFPRFDKLSMNYLSFIHFAGSLILLK